MIFSCLNLAVPIDIMQHVVRIESSGNPYAIGVVGGKLQRQPRNLTEAVATAQMLEKKGYNFSLGISQVNRYNLVKYGLKSYEHAFQVCPNLQAGSMILRECFDRSRDWGKSFSCYYSGNFVTGFRHGYVQKIFASMKKGTFTTPYLYGKVNAVQPIPAQSIALNQKAGEPMSQSAKKKVSVGSVVTRKLPGNNLPLPDRPIRQEMPIQAQQAQEAAPVQIAQAQIIQQAQNAAVETKSEAADADQAFVF